MARDDLALYLVLSPEFGGTRFGPFEGLEVRLGADRERCHIVLPEAFGVAREHCKLIRQNDGSLILAPSERTAAVFAWKGDARRPQQLQTPMSLRPGDRFALVSPEGACFTVEYAPLPPEVVAQRAKAKSRRNNLTADKFAQEGWRLLVARLWALGPVGMIMRGWYMLTSGALLQPRILIPLAIAAVGYMGTFASSCAAFKFKRDASSVAEELDECKAREGFSSSGGGLATRTPTQLIGELTGSTQLGSALTDQSDFAMAVQSRLRQLMTTRDNYRWLLSETGSARAEWIKWREAIDGSDKLDKTTKLLLPFAAAVPKRTAEDWNVVTDVRNVRSCVRGPARLTYRQAWSLGLDPVFLDAFRGDETVGFTDDEPGRLKLLTDAGLVAGQPALDPATPTEQAQIAAGREFCIFVSGDDARLRQAKTLAAFERHFGITAAAVPEVSQNEAPVARIAKLFAADKPLNRYDENDTPLLDFRNGMAGPLEEEPTKDQILERTADVIARSVGLPCILALEAPDAVEPTFGRKVDPVTCLVLDYKVRQRPAN